MYTLLKNGIETITFTEIKKYDVGTGYVALRNAKENTCILCRYLEPESRLLSENNHLLYDCTEDPTAREIGKPVVIMINEAVNFEKTDIVIKSVMKGLERIAERKQKKV